MGTAVRAMLCVRHALNLRRCLFLPARVAVVGNTCWWLRAHFGCQGVQPQPPPPLTHSTCAVPLTQQLGYAGLTLIDAAGQEWALVYSTAAHSLALYPAASLEHCAEQHPGAPLS